MGGREEAGAGEVSRVPTANVQVAVEVLCFFSKDVSNKIYSVSNCSLVVLG